MPCRAFVVLTSLLLAAPGSALSQAGAPGDPWLGTFLDSKITFTVTPGQGGAYQGNMQIGGQDYPFTAQKANGGLSGSFRSGGQTQTFQATLAGNMLVLVSGGQPSQLERRGSGAAGGGPSMEAPAGPAGVAATPNGQPGQQLSQLLTSSNWCSFSSNTTAGSSSTSRSTFRPDGILVEGGGQAQWRIQGGQLSVNLGNGWQLMPFQVALNSAGNPIITAGGKEYMKCN